MNLLLILPTQGNCMKPAIIFAACRAAFQGGLQTYLEIKETPVQDGSTNARCLIDYSDVLDALAQQTALPG